MANQKVGKFQSPGSFPGELTGEVEKTPFLIDTPHSLPFFMSKQAFLLLNESGEEGDSMIRDLSLELEKKGLVRVRMDDSVETVVTPLVGFVLGNWSMLNGPGPGDVPPKLVRDLFGSETLSVPSDLGSQMWLRLYLQRGCHFERDIFIPDIASAAEMSKTALALSTCGFKTGAIVVNATGRFVDAICDAVTHVFTPAETIKRIQHKVHTSVSLSATSLSPSLSISEDEDEDEEDGL